MAAALARRADHPYRAAVVAHDLSELGTALHSFSRDGRATGVLACPDAVRRSPKVAFVFPDRLDGDVGAAVRKLLRSEPVFRAQAQKWDRLLGGSVAGRSVLAELTAQADGPCPDGCSGPVLFTVQTALAALLRSWGVEPDAVAGRWIGAVSAAWTSGGIELPAVVETVCTGDDAWRALPGRPQSAATVPVVFLPDAPNLPVGAAIPADVAEITVEVNPQPVLLDGSGAPILLRDGSDNLSRAGRDGLLDAPLTRSVYLCGVRCGRPDTRSSCRRTPGKASGIRLGRDRSPGPFPSWSSHSAQRTRSARCRRPRRRRRRHPNLPPPHPPTRRC